MVTERAHDAKTKAITKSVKRVFIIDILGGLKIKCFCKINLFIKDFNEENYVVFLVNVPVVTTVRKLQKLLLHNVVFLKSK